MSEQHTHSHHHHHGGIDDYMKAVADIWKKWVLKQRLTVLMRNNLNVHLVLRVPAAKTALWDLAKLQKNPLVACVARTQI